MGRAPHLHRSARSYLSKPLHKFCFRFCHNHQENSAVNDRQEACSNTNSPRFSNIDLLNSGANRLDSHELAYLIRASTRHGCDSSALQLHGYTVKFGFPSYVFVSAALLSFYVEVGSLDDAHNLFDEIPEPNLVSWNTLISGYVRSGNHTKALDLFILLDRSETQADGHSITAALAACGRLSLLQLGRLVHSKIMKIGIEGGTFVSNCLIDMYGKCGLVEEAMAVFNGMVDKDNISWNSAIAANARNQRLNHALSFLHRMPNPDTISYNEVISGIAQFGEIEDAVRFLSSMKKSPNSSSWSSIITGYVNRGRAQEALDCLKKMHIEGVKMDQFTFSSILSGVASLASLDWGVAIHGCTIQYGLDRTVVVGTALIDMYSKCGQDKDSESVFKYLPRKNLISWNALIQCFARNGDFNKLVHYYNQLHLSGVKPDSVTFLNVISACSHSETPLEIAFQFLNSMVNDYRIEPTPEHCCSMIRLMGKKREIWRAKSMIDEFGFSKCVRVWRALLGACETCADLGVAETAAAKLMELGGDVDYVYVTLSNLYAYNGRWKEASEMRKVMGLKGIRKGVGCSWIEVEYANSSSSYIW